MHRADSGGPGLRRRGKLSESSGAVTLPASSREVRPSTARSIIRVALVRWCTEDLARESAVGIATIRRAEFTKDETSMTAANDLVIRRALEVAGVEFIDENGSDAGARLRQRWRLKRLRNKLSFSPNAVEVAVFRPPRLCVVRRAFHLASAARTTMTAVRVAHR